MTARNFPPIDPEAVALRLKGEDGLLSFRFYQTTSSTNDRAKEYLREAGPNGKPALLSAESQSSGRGRHGRGWHSPPSANLLFSLALPFGFCRGLNPDLGNLAGAVCVAEAIEKSNKNLNPTIKWPNDVEIEEGKLAGILTETTTKGIIFGIGVNVNIARDQFPPDLRETATSLCILTGRVWKREILLSAIVRRLLRWIRLEEPKRSESVVRKWKSRCSMLGRRVRASRGNHIIEGIAVDLDSGGGLVLRQTDGKLIHLNGGEVTLRAD